MAVVAVVVDDGRRGGANACQAEQPGPQYETRGLIEIGGQIGGAIAQGIPAQSDGRRFAFIQQQRAVVAFAVGAHVGVQLAVFRDAVELADHALGEEVLNGQVGFIAALEEDLQVLAVPLDGSVLGRDIAVDHLQQVLGARCRLDLAPRLDRHFLGCIRGNCDQSDFFDFHMDLPLK